MNKLNTNALVEAFKELLRTGLIAVIPLVIDGLASGIINWRTIGIAGAIAVLRAVDKWLHQKNVKSPLDFEGLDVLKK